MKFQDTIRLIKNLFVKQATAIDPSSEKLATEILSVRKGMCIHEVAIAGLQHDGREHIIRRLTLMDKLTFQRDYENPHDKNAVSIHNPQNKILGYLPRRYAEALAKQLDDGATNPETTIVRLEKDPSEKTYAVHVAICLPEDLMQSTTSPQLEFTCDRGSSGALYTLLNCEPVMLDKVVKQMKQKELVPTRYGSSIQHGSDGHKYNWFIRMDDSAEESQLLAFFQEHYGLQPWRFQPEEIEEYIESFDVEIESKDEEINSLKTKLEQANALIREKKKGIKISLEKARKDTIQSMLPNVALIRDSWDVIIRELAKPERALSLLQKLQVSPETLHAERVESTKGWLELHYNTGQKDDGRLYYKRTGQNTEVLISFKNEQKKDIRWMGKN